MPLGDWFHTPKMQVPSSFRTLPLPLCYLCSCYHSLLTPSGQPEVRIIMRQGNFGSRIPSFRSGIGLQKSGTLCATTVPRVELGFGRCKKWRKMEKMNKLKKSIGRGAFIAQRVKILTKKIGLYFFGMWLCQSRTTAAQFSSECNGLTTIAFNL